MLKLSVREADELANLGIEMLRLESLKDQTDVLISGHINGFSFDVPRAQAIEAVNARIAAIHKRCGELGVELVPPAPTAQSRFACGGVFHRLTFGGPPSDGCEGANGKIGDPGRG